MKWFHSIFRSGEEISLDILSSIQDKFKRFRALLDENNRALKVISDMEEKSQGEYLFDMNYIANSLLEIRAGVGDIIENMIALGGDEYLPLRERFEAINSEIDLILPGKRPIEKDDYTIFFDSLGRERAFSVGSKNAQLGEMKSKLGLPAPEGFAISAWAYKRFIEANDLQNRISGLLESVDIRRLEDLNRVSGQIREMIISSPVPQDLSDSIMKSAGELADRAAGERFAVRSSAIGEDTEFSFAGQYSSFLNVKAEQVVDKYREVVASKFSPKAIYYFLSHKMSESLLAMSVGCVEMVDAAASGVVYTKDPVNPGDGCLLINSIYGLGQYLVDGTLTPDTFRVSRADKSVVESCISDKPVHLVMNPEGGTAQEAVAEEARRAPSLSGGQIEKLAEHALKLESHYGCPQDIEWAVDRSGELILLQTRPLKVLEPKSDAEMPDVSQFEVLKSGGVTICPGAGGGAVFHARSSEDLTDIPGGAVLVTRNPFPGLVTAMEKISALVTEVGGVASHMAAIAREFRVPTLANVENASQIPSGTEVTVDATGGVIYAGIHRDLIKARRPEYELFEDTDIFAILEELLTKISPLNLLHPSSPDFMAENCMTLHDITRFCHQRAMEEMFTGAKEIASRESVCCRMKSEIPLPVDIIYLDKSLSELKNRSGVKDDEVDSEPMREFWSGIKREGWPKSVPNPNFKGFMTVMATSMTTGAKREFAENSYAILSREYMLVSLRMGYHFTTVEAMLTDEPSKNYIRMQYKEGGAAIERRVRRIKLIMDILSKLGFEHDSKGDFLSTMVSYNDAESIRYKLQMLGRLTMMTKQLDMALSSDSIAQWYTMDFSKKLGLFEEGKTDDK